MVMAKFQIISSNAKSETAVEQQAAESLSGNRKPQDHRLPSPDLASIQPSADGHELFAQLQKFPFNRDGVELSFSARLARDNLWTQEFADRVVAEYRKFLFLVGTQGHMVTPSEAVDEAWHLHLLYTHSYWDEFCGGILGRPLHHVPTEGGNDQQVHFKDCYRNTLEAYELAFNSKPPVDIWPDADERFRQAGRRRTVDLDRFWIFKKSSVTYWFLVGAVLVAMAMFAQTEVGAAVESMQLAGRLFIGGLWIGFFSLFMASLEKTDGDSGGCGGCGG
jgi:hypothetical protein